MVTGTSYLNLLKAAVAETDPIARYYYSQRDLPVAQKADMSPVTAADQEIERTLMSFFHKHLPNAVILGEEYGQSGETLDTQRDRIRIIIDPIDGTRNFIRGVPLVATLLAVECDGEIVAGLVSNPLQSEHWAAEKGAGATYNDKPIYVSQVATLAASQAFHGSLYGSETDGLPREQALALLSQTQRQRGFGDFYGHILVASGAGEFSFDVGFQPWDIAPLKIIVEEAGGMVTNFDGRFSVEAKSMICSNGRFHAQLVAAFKGSV